MKGSIEECKSCVSEDDSSMSADKEFHEEHEIENKSIREEKSDLDIEEGVDVVQDQVIEMPKKNEEIAELKNEIISLHDNLEDLINKNRILYDEKNKKE